MRNRIATTVLAGIAYLVSPQSAKAQDPVTVTYTTPIVPEELAINNEGLTHLLTNSADAQLFLNTLATGCTEFPDGSCRKFSPSQYQTGLERNLGDITLIEIDPQNSNVIYHKQNGKRNIIEVPSDALVDLKNISKAY